MNGRDEPLPWRWLTVVLVAALLVHWPACSNRFAQDDESIALAFGQPGNRMVSKLRPIGEYFATEYWTGSGATELVSNPLYRPITVWSLAVTHALFPGNAAGGNRDAAIASEALPHHVINVGLLLVAIVLVYLLARPLCPELAALLAAAVFAVHSLHTEVVASIVGRADLLAFCFGALATLLYAKGRAAEHIGRSVLWLAGCALALFLAFCSKESALPWVGMLAVYGLVSAWRSSEDRTAKLLARELALTGAVAVLPVAIWYLLRANAFAGLPDDIEIGYLGNPLASEPAAVRIATAIKIWGYGLYKTFWPFHLASDYGPVVFTPVRGFDVGFVAAAVALPAALIAGTWHTRRRPLVLLATASWFGFSFLTSNVPLAIGVQFAERLYFIPSVALSFLVAWAVTNAGPAKKWILGIVAIWIGACAVRSYLRSSDWRDNQSLFFADVARQPRSIGLRLHAAYAARQSGRRDLVVENLHAALALDPELGQAYAELGAHYLTTRQLDAAEQNLRKALTAKRPPIPSDRPLLRYNLGYLSVLRGRKTDAVRFLREATELGPDNTTVRHRALTLGLGLMPDSEFLAIVEEGERRTPHPYWRMHRGSLHFLRGRFAEAARDFAAALPQLSVRDFGVAPVWLDQAAALERTGRRGAAAKVLRALLAHRGVPTGVRRRAEAELGRLR